MTKIGAGGAGSSGGLVDYLEKENKLKPEQQAELWFSQNREQVAGHEVVAEIDHNKRNLGREDAKYYQVILAPSQAELAHIGSDPQKLKAFTRATMEEYAANFGKGIESKDLVWFAKIEHSRSFDHTNRAVQLGEQQKGTATLRASSAFCSSITRCRSRSACAVARAALKSFMSFCW